MRQQEEGWHIESTRERKRDTRRKLLAGSWVLARADQDPDAASNRASMPS